MKYYLLLFLLIISTLSNADNFRGKWKGQGQCGDSTIQITLNVIIQKDTIISAFLMEPAFFPITDSIFNGTDLHLQSSKFQVQNRNRKLLEKKAKGEIVTLCQDLKFEGGLTANLNQLSGEFTYLGKVYHAELFRGNQPLYRPQEPRKPYPYYCEDVKFTNKKDSVLLAGTLTLPQKEGKFPVVILKSGSMPMNRNGEDAGYHQHFLAIADYLTIHGIAVLRCDSRGVGKSTGNFWQSTAVDFADDLQAAYEYLSSRKDIKGEEIGIIGHSEGAMVAAMAASQTNNFKFIVMLGGPGVPLRNVFDMQRESKYKCGDFSSKEYERLKKDYEKLTQLVDQNMEQKFIYNAMVDYKKKVDTAQIDLSLDTDQNLLKESSSMFILRTITSPHDLFNLKVDPAEYISKLTCPVLSLNGSNDLLVDAKTNQQAIRQALIKAGNKDFKIMELEGLNHSFQECKTGAAKESLSSEQTFSPKALEIITQWIKEHVEK